MDNLSPFQTQHDAPLTGGARFIRGFQRIGFAIATLIILFGIAWAIVQGNNHYSLKSNKFAEASCVAEAARDKGLNLSELSDRELDALYNYNKYNAPIRNDNNVSRALSAAELSASRFAFAQILCPRGSGFSHDVPLVDRGAVKAALVAALQPPSALDDWLVPVLILMGCFVIAAVTAFFACAAIGWVFAGFTRGA